MTWSTFYLVCFGVGFALSLLSFLGGALHLHLPMKWHLPHGWLHHGGLAHGPLHLGCLHGHGGAHGALPQVAHVGAPGALMKGTAQVSPFNFSTLMAFLAWFGGSGYLVTQYYRFWYLLGLGVAMLIGLGGASIVFLFLTRVLMPYETALDPADYDLLGVLAMVTIPIREGGTGEIVFSQGGTRRSAGARARGARVIERGTEVVITDYDKGIAYVEPWDELTA